MASRLRPIPINPYPRLGWGDFSKSKLGRCVLAGARVAHRTVTVTSAFGTFEISGDVCSVVANGWKAEVAEIVRFGRD
jgi:hypothetical protein